MKSFLSTFVLICLFVSQSFSQRGSVLLVGGGSEKNNVNSWSTSAYKQAAAGKRVAVIGTSTGSLAYYLTRYCDASYAKEFAVSSRDSADSQILYDTLLTYQMIFFRGGDQYDYYRYYRNTRLQQAVETLFSQGGVIGGTSAGMHILSSVLFTARNGTVYPYEAIENPNNRYMTLADDFFDFFPGYLFDTHFSERSRFARLAGFLAKYEFDTQNKLIGIGMDDMTCIFVDSNNIATVYGTGCANIYSFDQSFQLHGSKLLHPEIQVMQLIQGCTYDFNTGEINTPTLEKNLDTASIEETGNFVLLASGGNNLSENNALLDDLVNSSGNPSDDILLLTYNQNKAQLFADRLIQLGSGHIDLFILNQSNGSNEMLAAKINQAKKILFVENTTYNLNEFLQTPNGRLLSDRLSAKAIIAAFIGDDARFAGKTVVDNYYDYLASWYGELEFSRGLGMLQHSLLMPNTYFNSDMYENTATSVPYAMSIDTLRFGIWLTSKSYLKIMPVEGMTTLLGFGQHPIMILRHDGGLTGLTTQTGTGSNTAVPRMEAGFSNLTFSLVDETLPYLMGVTEASSLDETATTEFLKIAGNPVQDELKLYTSFQQFYWTLSDMHGRCLEKGFSTSNHAILKLNSLKPGTYALHVKDDLSNIIIHRLIIKL